MRMVKGLAERLSLWLLPDWQRLMLLAILFLDLLLLGIFLLWAYVEHHHIPGVLLGNLRFSLVDGSYAEDFGYLKQALIVVLLLGLWRNGRDILTLGFALLFLTTLFDDALELHERMAGWAGGLWHLPAGSQGKGEIVAFGLLGILPTAVILIGYFRAEAARRRDGEVLALGFGILFFFAVVADYIHEKVVEATGHYDTALSLFEDGGELLAMSLILGITLRLCQLSRAASPHPVRASHAGQSAAAYRPATGSGGQPQR